MTTAMTCQPETYGHDPAQVQRSVEEYQRMAMSGILTEDDKVELLENFIVPKMTKNPRHECTIQLLLRLLLPLLPAEWDVRLQSSIALADSQPEPDLAIVRGDAQCYWERHPGIGDVGLVIEVAETSLRRDQTDKARIYARASIPCYWIVNLVDDQIEVYEQPSGPTPAPTYATPQIYHRGAAIPFVLDGVQVGELAVNSVLR